MPMPKPAEGTESDTGVLGGGLRCRMPAASPSMPMPSHGCKTEDIIDKLNMPAGWMVDGCRNMIPTQLSKYA
jgi:hypothetical protein